MSETISSITHFTQRLPHQDLFLTTNVPYQGTSYLPTPTPTEYMGPDTPVSIRGRYNDDNNPTDVELSPAPPELPPIVVTHPSPSPRIPSHPLEKPDNQERHRDDDETECCWGYVDCEDGSSPHTAPRDNPGRSNRPSTPIQLPPITPRGDPRPFNTSDLRSTS